MANTVTAALDDALDVLAQGKDTEESECAMDYLLALVPLHHPARAALETFYQVHDEQRTDEDTVKKTDDGSLLAALPPFIRAQLRTEPVDVDTITTGEQLRRWTAEENVIWSDSDLTIHTLGLGRVGDSSGCGHLEPTVVLSRCHVPIAQINAGLLFTLATNEPTR